MITVNMKKDNLELGDLVKTQKGVYIVIENNFNKTLKNLMNPMNIISLDNFTTDLLDKKRFSQHGVENEGINDIIAIRKHDSKSCEVWDFERESALNLDNGFFDIRKYNK